MLTCEPLAPVDEDEESQQEDDPLANAYIDDQTTEAADLEAAQLLQGLRTFQQVADADADVPRPRPAAAAAAAGDVPAAAVAADAAGGPPKRKPGRPRKNAPKQDDPANWEPKEVSVTITAGSLDIDPAKLDEMENFVTQFCMAGMSARLHLLHGCPNSLYFLAC